eukprot:GHVP01062837.1.p1 GENE.GHVP01062837.1~~GHVP01062837.1.p1  ORF type:complete len:324 (+),score=88.80 GHVP01062837.1:73-1044(+)
MAVDILTRLQKELGEYGPKKRGLLEEDALESGISNSPPDEGDPMLMKNFFRLTLEAKGKIKFAQKITKEMEDLYKEFDGNINTEKLEEIEKDLNKKQDAQDLLFNQIRIIITEIDAENKKVLAAPKDEMRPADARMRMTQYPHLCKLFSETLRIHQEMQTFYREKHKEKIEEQYKTLNPDATIQGFDSLFGDDEEKKKAIQGELENAREDAKGTLSAVNNRLESMKTLEDHIVTISKLFLDMQNIVLAQGSIINKIEDEMEKAVEHVEQATIEIKESQKIADEIRAKKWIMASFIVVIVIIAAIGAYKLFLVNYLGFPWFVKK